MHLACKKVLKIIVVSPCSAGGAAKPRDGLCITSALSAWKFQMTQITWPRERELEFLYQELREYGESSEACVSKKLCKNVEDGFQS